MYSTNKILLIIFVTMISLVISMPVNASHWEKLGTRSVKRGIDKDVMRVSITEGGFRKIKISVKKSPVNIKKLVIEYANGNHDELKVRAVISAGGESRLMDLQGGKRVIRKVTFYYETIEKGRGKSIVTAWARK